MNRYIKSFLLVAIALPMVGSSCYSQHSIETKKIEKAKTTKKTKAKVTVPLEVANSRAPCKNTCLRLIKDPNERKNNFGNPIYQLELFLNGKELDRFDTVSGRADTQDFNRHKSGTEAPLPDGNYSIDKIIVPGTIPEVGETFLGIQPRFSTGRTALGIHYDPSFNKDKKEDGTSGCIGLTTTADRSAVFEFVRQYKPQLLIVDIK